MNQKDPDALISMGMESDDPAIAMDAFEDAIAIDPSHAQAWYCKGCLHAEQGQADEAIAAYEKSIELAGDHASLPLFNLGNVYQQLGRVKEAATAFQRATEIDPAFADAWINLGRILDDHGGHESAIECYDYALSTEPEDEIAWANRGNSLRSLRRFDDAIESFDKALKLNENNLAAAVGMATCLGATGSEVRALEMFEKLIEQTDHPLVHFEKATLLATTNDHPAALRIYDKLLDDGFESAEIWNNRAECLASTGQSEKALESFDDAIEFDPAFPHAYFGKGRLLVNLERIDEAREVVDQYKNVADEEMLNSPAAKALIKMVS